MRCRVVWLGGCLINVHANNQSKRPRSPPFLCVLRVRAHRSRKAREIPSPLPHPTLDPSYCFTSLTYLNNLPATSDLNSLICSKENCRNYYYLVSLVQKEKIKTFKIAVALLSLLWLYTHFTSEDSLIRNNSAGTVPIGSDFCYSKGLMVLA